MYRGVAKFLRGDITQSLEDVRHALHLKPYYEAGKTWQQLIEAKINNDDELFGQIKFHLVHRSGKPFIDFMKIKNEESLDTNSMFSSRMNTPNKFNEHIKGSGVDDETPF